MERRVRRRDLDAQLHSCTVMECSVASSLRGQFKAGCKTFNTSINCIHKFSNFHNIPTQRKGTSDFILPGVTAERLSHRALCCLVLATCISWAVSYLLGDRHSREGISGLLPRCNLLCLSCSAIRPPPSLPGKPLCKCGRELCVSLPVM